MRALINATSLYPTPRQPRQALAWFSVRARRLHWREDTALERARDLSHATRTHSALHSTQLGAHLATRCTVCGGTK